MDEYIKQLVSDIDRATATVCFPFAGETTGVCDWISDDEEDLTAPIRRLEEWTAINHDQLPPSQMLRDDQISILLLALKNMLNAFNYAFVVQQEVPERIQYDSLRDNFDQDVKAKQWHMGFFEHCRPGTKHGKCALGQYCQCVLYADLFSNFEEDNRNPQEQRQADLEIEVRNIKRKYGDEWMKYYPYHLDENFDDQYGNPYDYQK